MFTINGIGTKYHGFVKQPDGSMRVTLWVVFLFIPILPIRSVIMHPTAPGSEFDYTEGNKVRMNLKEVLITYLLGWIVTPILWFWPIPFAVREVGTALGYTNENGDGAFYTFVFVFAIIYMLVFAWMWKDWEENRWSR